jgi:hypothetical protein
MSLHIVKSFERPLALIAAALLIHVGGAVAAEPTGEVQQQMRELLAGRIATQATQLSAQRADGTVRPTADMQELARRLLSGATDAHSPGRSGDDAARECAARAHAPKGSSWS